MEGFNFTFNLSLGHKSQEVLLEEIMRGARLVGAFGQRIKEKNNGYCPDCCITFNFNEGEPGESKNGGLK